MATFDKEQVVKSNRTMVRMLQVEKRQAIASLFTGVEPNKGNVDLATAVFHYTLDAFGINAMQHAIADPSLIQPGETMDIGTMRHHIRETVLPRLDAIRKAADELEAFYRAL